VTTTILAYIPSPSQGVWHLGPIPLRAYALFIVAGMLAALLIGDKRWQERGGEPGVIYSIFWWAMPFGLIGGRLYHVITDWQTYFGDDGAGLLAAFRIWEGGLGIWGAVALGGVGAWIGCRQHGIPLPAFGDAVAPGIVLAQAIGRMGNYFNQELYGRPTTLPWGLEIYERRDAGGYIDSLNGVSTGQLVEVVHPTFLYELLWNVLVFAVLIYIDRRFKIGHGRLFAMYVAGYCLGRFWIELMRSDHASMPVEGIRVNSFTATFVFIGAVVYIMVAQKGREDPATLRGNAPEAVRDGEEDTAVEEFVKELTGVAAATTGVVAAAKVAGEFEDEDAKAAADGSEEEPREAEAEESEAAEDVAVGGVGAVEGEEVVEAEEAAPEVHEAAVDAAEEAEEVAAESEAAANDVEPEAETDAEEAEAVVEAEAETDEAVEAESVGGVGAVEGEEVVEAEEAAPEVHEAAVDAAEEAEEVAAESEAAANDAELDAEAEEADAVVEAPEAVEAESVGGVGAVEGEEVVEAEEAAPEVHEAAVDAAEEAEEVAADSEAAANDAELDAEAEEADAVVEAEPEADEPETEDAEASVGEAETEPSEEEAAEEAESVAEEADAVDEQEPGAEILGEEPDESPVQAPEEGGRLRRWLRRRG
jgi:prolipoprotein diacylglyceryl transferase